MRINRHGNAYKQNRFGVMSKWNMTIGALLLISVTSSTAVPGLQEQERGCAENFTERNNYCYRYFEKHKAFYPAQQHCKSHSAYLVTIYNQYEQQFLHNLSGGVAHWIALNDAEGPGAHHVEGVFKWDNDYKPISYQNWQEGEPNNKNHLDCVASNELGWFMVTSGCATAKLPYICKQTAVQPIRELQWNNSVNSSGIWMILLIISVVLVCIVQCNGRDVIK